MVSILLFNFFVWHRSGRDLSAFVLMATRLGHHFLVLLCEQVLKAAPHIAFIFPASEASIVLQLRMLQRLNCYILVSVIKWPWNWLNMAFLRAWGVFVVYWYSTDRDLYGTNSTDLKFRPGTCLMWSAWQGSSKDHGLPKTIMDASHASTATWLNY